MSTTAIWFLVSLSCAARLLAQGAGTSATQASDMTVEQAIAELPPIGREGLISKDRKRWVEAAAVEQLREHLEAGGTLSNEQWREALRRSRAIHLRERWPVAFPLAISVQRPHWLPLAEIRVQPRREDFRAAEAGSFKRPFCGNCSESRYLRESYQELGSLPLGKHHLSFDVQIEIDADGQESASYDSNRQKYVSEDVRSAWRGTIEMDVEIVATVAEAMPGRQDAELDRAVRAKLRIALADGSLTFTEPLLYESEALAATAVSLEYELRRAEEVVHSRRLLGKDIWRAGTMWSSWEVPADPLELAQWTLRVRGIDEGVLRFARADHWWNGELVIALSELARR